jgi:phosphoglycerate dehydrogenase-like enzyme
LPVHVRPRTVDPKALYEALKGKKIQSAAIDVTAFLHR